AFASSEGNLVPRRAGPRPLSIGPPPICTASALRLYRPQALPFAACASPPSGRAIRICLSNVRFRMEPRPISPPFEVSDEQSPLLIIPIRAVEIYDCREAEIRITSESVTRCRHSASAHAANG